jgi:lysozyme
MWTKRKTTLSAAVLALIATGASGPRVLNQFLNEKEGMPRLVAYQDGSGYWTICGGVHYLPNGKEVARGTRLTEKQCDAIDTAERAKALEWVNKNIHYPLTEYQKVGLASFCPWNLGVGKCMKGDVITLIQDGKLNEACTTITTYIHDRGRDCRIRDNNCYGQVLRREQEADLLCQNFRK